MTTKKIKIIKGVGPQLTTEQLEAASLRLLVSRIRGGEPQVSFTFVQRLLDELISRRRKETEVAPIEVAASVADVLAPASDEWLDGSDDLEESADLGDLVTSADLLISEGNAYEWPSGKVFEFEDLELAASEGLPPRSEHKTIEIEDEDELVETANAWSEPTRRPVLACSKPREQGWSTVNYWRVLVISLLVAFTMVCGVVFMGCNHHDREQATPYVGRDFVDGVPFVYKDIEQNVVEPETERRQRLLAAAVVIIDTFKRDHGAVPPVWTAEIYLGPTVEENPGFVPCYIPNGGGCYIYKTHHLMVIGGDCDNLPYLYHELTHARLDALGEDRLRNNGHVGPDWELSAARTAELIEQICGEGHH